MDRKYENGFTIINNSSKSTIYKIKVLRKAKKSKSDTCIYYDCDVWHKGREDGWPMLMVIGEPTIDEIVILNNINN